MVNSELKQKYIKLLEDCPLIHSVSDEGTYLKIFTEILMGETDTFLNLFLIFNDDEVCLTDSNEVFNLCEGFYDLPDEKLADFARYVGLDYNKFRFTKIVNLNNIIMEIQKFDKLKDLIVKQ